MKKVFVALSRGRGTCETNHISLIKAIPSRKLILGSITIMEGFVVRFKQI